MILPGVGRVLCIRLNLLEEWLCAGVSLKVVFILSSGCFVLKTQTDSVHQRRQLMIGSRKSTLSRRRADRNAFRWFPGFNRFEQNASRQGRQQLIQMSLGGLIFSR